MKTKDSRLKKIDSKTDKKRELKLIKKEIKRNPWYVYRNYLSDRFGPETSPVDISVSHSIFNGINTWVESNHKVDISYDAILKSIICLAMQDKFKGFLILLPNARRAIEIRERMYRLIDKIPGKLLETRSLSNIVITSSFDHRSLGFECRYYSCIVALDLDGHRNVNKFFTAHSNTTSKSTLFVFANTKFPNGLLTDNQALICKLSSDNRVIMEDELLGSNVSKLKRSLRGRFLVHSYFY